MSESSISVFWMAARKALPFAVRHRIMLSSIRLNAAIKKFPQMQFGITLLRAVARRTLPAATRQWLVRSYFRLETALGKYLERRYQARPVPLERSPTLYTPAAFSEGPIVMVNNALASGGVERQIVNTLRDLGACPDRAAGLLCLRLGDSTELDFFRPALTQFPGFVRNAMPQVEARGALADSFGPIHDMIGWMPSDIRQEVVRFAAEFVALKPFVVHSWQDSVGISATYAAKIVGVPRIILSTRNVRPTNFPWYRPHMLLAHREIAKCGNIIMLNNSEAGRDDYAQWLGVSPQRFVVIRNGLDLTSLRKPTSATLAGLRAQLEIPNDAPIVGSMFRFYEEKRPSLWIQTASEIARQRPDVHFVIFGEGPLQEAAKALAQRLRFGDRFHAPGKIADASAGLSLFDVFLLTSEFEGTPNVVLEASGLGIPVVATDAGGTAETIEHGITGYLVRSSDPAAIAARVIETLASPEWRARAQSAAPAFVERRFGMSRMVSETLALYGMKDR